MCTTLWIAHAFQGLTKGKGQILRVQEMQITECGWGSLCRRDSVYITDTEEPLESIIPIPRAPPSGCVLEHILLCPSANEIPDGLVPGYHGSDEAHAHPFYKLRFIGHLITSRGAGPGNKAFLFQETTCLGFGIAFPATSGLKKNTIRNSFCQDLQFCRISMICLPPWEGPGCGWTLSRWPREA